MVTPLSIASRLVNRVRPLPPVGRCCMCGQPVAPGQEFVRIRGGPPVHNACATYRIRQQIAARHS